MTFKPAHKETDQRRKPGQITTHRPLPSSGGKSRTLDDYVTYVQEAEQQERRDSYTCTYDNGGGSTCDSSSDSSSSSSCD